MVEPIVCDEHWNVRALNDRDVRTLMLDCFYCWALTFGASAGYLDREGILELAQFVLNEGGGK